MIMESAIAEAMNLQDLHDYVNKRTPEELQTLIEIAKKRINKLDQEKEEKFMTGIRKAIQAYLDECGDLSFNVEYEDEDGNDASTTITVDRNNPPACNKGTIYI